MTKLIPLSTGLGEVIAPGTLMTALILSPDGAIQLDGGALHGRSAIESAVRFVSSRDQVPDAQRYRVIWVAVELDASNQPARYKGLAASELWIDLEHKTGYKALADSVNRMSEAMGGRVNLTALSAQERSQIGAHLASLSSEAWARSPQALTDALK